MIEETTLIGSPRSPLPVYPSARLPIILPSVYHAHRNNTMVDQFFIWKCFVAHAIPKGKSSLPSLTSGNLLKLNTPTIYVMCVLRLGNERLQNSSYFFDVFFLSAD